MNKQFRELQIQAFEQCNRYEGGDSIRTDEVFQRFGELIIEGALNCGKTLVDHYINSHPEQDQAMLLAAIADYAALINERFGVSK